VSTKSTISYGDHYHFYNDLGDEEGAYLELSGVDTTYEVSAESVMIRIPNEILKEIAKYGAKLANEDAKKKDPNWLLTQIASAADEILGLKDDKDDIFKEIRIQSLKMRIVHLTECLGKLED
jgi:hypothetical protein